MRSTIRAVFAIDRQLPSVRDTGTPKLARSEQIRRSHAIAMAQTAAGRRAITLGNRRDPQALDAIDDRIETALVGDAGIAISRTRGTGKCRCRPRRRLPNRV